MDWASGSANEAIECVDRRPNDREEVNSCQETLNPCDGRSVSRTPSLPQRSSTLARRVAHFQHFDAPLLTVSDQQFQYRHPERPFTPIRRPDYFDEQNTSSDKGLFARVLLLDLRRFCLTVLPRLPKLMSTFTKQGRQRRGSRYHDIAGDRQTTNYVYGSHRNSVRWKELREGCA